MLKNHLADECIHLAERVVPELGSMVEKRYISTPLTYRDYTLSPCGSAYGVRKDCRNILMTTLSPRTSIPNLLLTGQSLMLHGVEGVTMTALQTCGELLGKDYIQTIIK
jgi:all-trans-retinol 13,14-reductase